ncbi:MAG TPA: HhH-GPD-type base excision DNA repair protein [Nitriliruptorales bacterium]
MTKPDSLHFTGEPEADELLARDPLALLIGMLLDQQYPMEQAFLGPYRIVQRLGRELDARAIAAMDPDELHAVFQQTPAVHRYHGSMAKRTQKLCQHLVDEYGADAGAVWRDAETGRELFRRLKALPGYGDAKATILVALLGKRLGVQPEGWREAAGEYGKDGIHRSIADVATFDDIEKVRHTKQVLKGKA